MIPSAGGASCAPDTKKNMEINRRSSRTDRWSGQAFGTPARRLTLENRMTHNELKMTQSDAKAAVNLPRSPGKVVVQKHETRLIDAIPKSKLETS